MGPGYAAFKLAFQLSPILLVNGIAGTGAGTLGVPGGILPLIAVTQASSLVLGLLSGADDLSLDSFFAHFRPLPGSTLIENQVGLYPFANQKVAGNAIIQQATNLSMLMDCPARDTLGYASKIVTMNAIKMTLDQHNSLGGTYTVLTPSFFYTNGILLRLEDASPQADNQIQSAYRLDFTFPLLTLNQTQSVQSSLMAKITGGAQVDASGGSIGWTGLSQTVGQQNSLAGGSIFPIAGGLTGTTAPLTSSFGGAAP